MATETAPKKKACVVGGTGFVASLLVKLLLQKGYAVNTTVREPGNAKKIVHLLQLQTLGELKIFGANLTEEGSFDEPISGCEFVFHVATPGYPASKTLAEKTALKFAEENNIDLATIIPSLMTGSSLTPDVPSSVALSTSLITGLFVAEKESASGRYICCAVNTSVPDLAKFLATRYPQYKVPISNGDRCDSNGPRKTWSRAVVRKRNERHSGSSVLKSSLTFGLSCRKRMGFPKEEEGRVKISRLYYYNLGPRTSN